VLDEADEMLRMGFIDDVEWILEHTPGGPPDRAVLGDHAGGSAASPIATCAIRDLVKIAARTTTATIRQRYWQVSGLHKLDALTRILEIEPSTRR
jgi:ATP-dependent RNA helicase DeaD